jgi:hypothetical protein
MTFDTGLSPEQFAKQKQAHLLTLKGRVLRETGNGGFLQEDWQADGVREENGRRVVYGRAVSGTRFDLLLEAATAAGADSADAGLSAFLLWRRALCFLIGTNEWERVSPAPRAAYIDTASVSVFFPPPALARTAADAESQDGFAWLRSAVRWMHPDRRHEEALAWTSAACLYRIFTGEEPFDLPALSGGQSLDVETAALALLSDIREGVCVPMRLAAPGLDNAIAAYIDAALIPHPRNSGGGLPPFPQFHPEIEKNYRPLSDAERSSALRQKTAFLLAARSKASRKRFLVRNKPVLLGASAALLILVFFAGSMINARLSRWSARGLSPGEIVNAYYTAFGKLDHEVMSACVLKNAGKSDIDMTVNLFVVSKMREAYERKQTVLDAAEWDGVSPLPPDMQVFGVRLLSVDWPDSDERDGAVTAHARYLLIAPSTFSGDAEPVNDGSPPVETPIAAAREDTLTLLWNRDRWQVAQIDRKEAPPVPVLP